MLIKESSARIEFGFCRGGIRNKGQREKGKTTKDRASCKHPANWRKKKGNPLKEALKAQLEREEKNHRRRKSCAYLRK